MARVSSRLDLDAFKADLDRIARMPGESTVRDLERTLDEAFAVTQAFVHIDTGQLKASGRTRSYEYNGEWGGAITYGGAAAFYAGFEFSRDGHHPFDDDPALRAVEERFEEVISDALHRF